jgi:heme exporter protein B
MLSGLIRKEMLLEFRQKSALGGVIVYVAGTIFITSLCFLGRVLEVNTWNTLFWIISLFTSVTINGRSFLKETGGTGLYNYLYYSPQKFILAKVLYNMIFMLALSLITFCFYAFFMKIERLPDQEPGVGNMPLFLIVLVLASTGLAGVLSLMSAIAAKANGNFAMMSILSFPVIMPMILVIIRLSKQAVDGIEWAGVSFSLMAVLLALNVITVLLSFLLFPYLWRD